MPEHIIVPQNVSIRVLDGKPTVINDSAPALVVKSGPVGPQGEQGPPGPPGPSGNIRWYSSMLMAWNNANLPPYINTPGNGIDGRAFGRSFPKSAANYAGGYLDILPDDWASIDVYINWMSASEVLNPTTKSFYSIVNLASIPVGYSPSGVEKTTLRSNISGSGSAGVRERSLVASSFSIIPGSIFKCVFHRNGPHSEDSWDSDITLLGVEIRRSDV